MEPVKVTPPARRRLTPPGPVIGLATLALLVGALAVRSGIVFGLVVLAAIFIPLERVFALRPQRVLRPGWRTDIVHFVVNNLLSTVGIVLAVGAVGTLLRAVIPQAVSIDVVHQPASLQFIEALLLAELGGYWGHRTTHAVPVLWRFHKVHHSIKEMDWLASARLHPVDQAFTRSCAIIPLYALGFSRSTFGAFLLFTTFQALFVHANVRFRFGPLRWIVATPEFHHWHHAKEQAAYNSNFAGELPLMDLMFGPLRMPKGQMPTHYGIDERLPPGYLGQLSWPFRRSQLGGLNVDRALSALS
jgi:sterol desaturase/sphingolipid hydroxylase (fatty acid hydroxylase superfamily)